MKKLVILAVVSVLFAEGLAADDRYDLALVSIADENVVSIFELDKQTAELVRLGHYKVNGDAGSQFFDSRRSVLYLGLRNAGKIAVLELDRKRKKLTQIDEVVVDKDPAYLRVDRSGKWLFGAYYATGRISCFGLNENGTLKRKKGLSASKDKSGNASLENPQWISTAPRAHAIVDDKSGRFVFVPHTGPNAIFQFRFDGQTGILKTQPKPKLTFATGTGPRHIVPHPVNDSLWFCINEQGSSVTSLIMDANGNLTPKKTLSTLPGNFSERNACADLEISADGRLLFAANRGHDSLAVFQIANSGNSIDGNSRSWDFKRTGIYATEKTPRQFGVTVDDRFLISAGQGSDKLALFRIDSKSGGLTKLKTVKTGKRPWWISVID